MKAIKTVLTASLVGVSGFAGVVVFASAISGPSENDFRYLTDITIRSVIDAPPFSEGSVFYTGKEYTPASRKGLFSLFNPNGTMITDNNLNHYFVKGSESIDFKNAAVYVSNNNQYRLCNIEVADKCIDVTSVTEFKDNLSKMSRNER